MFTKAYLSLFTESTIRVIAFLCNEKHQHIAQRWSDRFSQESAKQQWPWDFSISSETIFIINTILPWPTKSFKRAKEGRVGFWWHLLTDSETRCSGPSSLCRLSDPDSYSHFIRPTSSIPQWTWFRQNSFYDLLIMNKGRTLSRWCFSSMEKGNLTNAHPTTALQQWQWHAPPNCSGTSYFGWYLNLYLTGLTTKSKWISYHPESCHFLLSTAIFRIFSFLNFVPLYK